MAQELALHRQQSPSLERKAAAARSHLAQPTTRLRSLDLAEKLIGSFSNCRPPDAKVFADSVAQVLQKYPLGLAEEACDPQRGAALAMDWLGLKALGDWCDARMEYYAKLARYQAPPVRLEPPSDPTMAARVCALFKDLADALRAKQPSPLDRMHEEVAQARKLRIEEVMRRAQEQPAAGAAAQ